MTAPASIATQPDRQVQLFLLLNASYMYGGADCTLWADDYDWGDRLIDDVQPWLLEHPDVRVSSHEVGNGVSVTTLELSGGRSIAKIYTRRGKR